MLNSVPVQDSVGMVLGHDITSIVPGEFKGRAYKKGHIVTPENIPILLTLGKEHLYVLSLENGFIHEEEAAARIAAAIAGPGLEPGEACEGRINLQALYDGLFKVDVDALERINSLESSAVATLHTKQAVNAGHSVAGTRIVPLVIEEERIAAVEAICAETPPVLQVAPFTPMKIGLVTTGSAVYHGRIKDGFGPAVGHALFRLYIPRSVTDALSQLWGCATHSHYGTVETGLSGAVDCGALTGMHVREADLIVEILDPVTQTPREPGTWGELVVTTLHR